MGFFSSYKKYFLRLVPLALPIIAGNLAQVVLGLIDTLMVGQLGPSYLDALSLANAIFILPLVLAIGTTMAIGPMVSEAIGAKDLDFAGKVLRQGIVFNTLFSMILVAITWSVAQILPYLELEDPNITIYAKHYLSYIAFSIFPATAFLSYKGFLEGIGKAVPVMVIGVVILVVNVFLNWVFIYGNLGAPQLYTAGAGLATLISRFFGVGLLQLYLIVNSKTRKFKPYPIIKGLDRKIGKKIFKIGLPSGFQYFFEVGAFSSANLLVGLIGRIELAAHHIAIQLASVTYMVALGISGATSILVGNEKGRQRKAAMRKAGYIGIYTGGAFMVLSATLFVLLRNYLPVPFIKSEFRHEELEVIDLASMLLVIAALFQISDGVQAIGLGALRGLSDVKYPTIITLIAYWGIGLPAGCILAFVFNFGVYGIWVGLALGLTISAIWLTERFGKLTSLEKK